MPVVRAVDCHAHVFCDATYAFAADAVYTPDPSQRGTEASFLCVLDAHGFTHGLLMRVVLGPVESDGMRLVSSALGMVAAIAIWLAFFPPAAYRRRMARSATV